MIGRLQGTLLSKEPPLLLVDVGGVGYEVEAPMTVFAQLPANGETVTLLTHLSIKDDAHTLYGFSSADERSLFRSLLKISGIGAKLALTILSGASGAELSRMVAQGDTAALTRLPGIGKKTAERLIVELKDKLDGIGQSAGVSLPGSATPTGGAAGEAVAALQSLGYKGAEAVRMVRAVEAPDLDAAALVRQALKQTMRQSN